MKRLMVSIIGRKNKLKIEVIRDFDAFLGLKEAWDEMVSNRFDGHPFLDHFWFANYYRAYFRKSPLFVSVAYDDGELIAALPMIVARRRLAGIALKEMRLLAGDHSHVNRLPIPDENHDLFDSFLDRLIEEGIDVVYLEDVPEDFPDSGHLEEYCLSRKYPMETWTARRSPFIPTAGEFDEYRKGLSKKFRQLLNNRLNRINRAGGFEIRTFREPGDYEKAVEDMKVVASESWQGKNRSGIFSGENNDLFYRDLINHTFKTGCGRIHILYFENRPAAFEFHIIHGSTEYCLKAEYSLELEKLSPGAVLDLELVKKAFASDIKVYDLLGYEDQYKLRWTDEVTPYRRYFIFGRSAAARGAYLLYCRWGRSLRQNRLIRRWLKR